MFLQRAVDSRRATLCGFEEAGKPEQLGLLDDVGKVGAAGKVAGDTHRAEAPQQVDRTRDEVFGGGPATLAQGQESVTDTFVQPPEEFGLVARRRQRCGARPPDLLFELHGLVDRLSSGEARDEFPAAACVLTAWRGRVGGGESVAEVLLHHLLPTGAQEGQGSVEVEQGVANAPRHDLDVIEDPNGCTDRGAWGWGVLDKRKGNGPERRMQGRPGRWRRLIKSR